MQKFLLDIPRAGPSCRERHGMKQAA